MAEDDRFAHLLRELGEPENARKLPAHEAGKYKGRVPRALIDFWVEHGFGSYKKGFFTLCDPIAFDPVVRTIFKNDPEIDADDLSIVGYTASSDIIIAALDRDGRNISIDLTVSELSISPRSSLIDPQTGLSFSPNLLIGALVTSFMQFDMDTFDEDMAKVSTLA